MSTSLSAILETLTVFEDHQILNRSSRCVHKEKPKPVGTRCRYS